MRRLIFILCTILLTNPCFAEKQLTSKTTSLESNLQEEKVPQTKLEQLKIINKDIADLYIESKKINGNQQDILRMQLFVKNQERREIIYYLLFSEKNISKKQKIKMLNEQFSFVNKSLRILKNYNKTKFKNYTKKSVEEQLFLLKERTQLKEFAIKLYNNKLENYEWATKLGIDKTQELKKFQAELKDKLELISAVLNYDLEQKKVIANELKSSSENEKSNLELELQLYTRKANSDTNEMQAYIKLADTLKITTTDYKQQLFETTGKITKDVLDFQVIKSLISSWTSKSFIWIKENAPQTILKIFVFIGILLLGHYIKRITRQIVERITTTKRFDVSRLMQEFLISMSGKLVVFIALLIALAQIGLDLTPILTGFGVAGIIIGFALQNTLSNFAAGMMLLIYRPFDVGDFVEAGSVSGKVSSLSLVSTTIRTFDNQIVIVPNNNIWGNTITNLTKEKTRRVDMVFGIGYDDDLQYAENLLHEIINKHSLILKRPAPIIKLHTLNDSSVDFIVRPWCKTADYWDIYWDITKEVKLRFDKEGISIPYPQQELHVRMLNSDNQG